MGGKTKYAQTPPVKGCDHAYHMTYAHDRCWCGGCGQTWKFRYYESGLPRGWWPVPLHKASHGESIW